MVEPKIVAGQNRGGLGMMEQTKNFFESIKRDLDKSVEDAEKKYDFKFEEIEPEFNDHIKFKRHRDLLSRI